MCRAGWEVVGATNLMPPRSRPWSGHSFHPHKDRPIISPSCARPLAFEPTNIFHSKYRSSPDLVESHLFLQKPTPSQPLEPTTVSFFKKTIHRSHRFLPENTVSRPTKHCQYKPHSPSNTFLFKRETKLFSAIDHFPSNFSNLSKPPALDLHPQPLQRFSSPGISPSLLQN